MLFVRLHQDPVRELVAARRNGDCAAQRLIHRDQQEEHHAEEE
jgi:hypothetical protein